jgi:hypothetical protein
VDVVAEGVVVADGVADPQAASAPETRTEAAPTLRLSTVRFMSW